MIPKTAATIPTSRQSVGDHRNGFDRAVGPPPPDFATQPSKSSDLRRFASTVHNRAKGIAKEFDQALIVQKEGYFENRTILRIADMLVQSRGTLPPSKHEQLVKQD